MTPSSLPSEPSAGPAGAADDVAPLRDLLLTAGLEVLERDGLELGADALGYTRVFAHLESTHGVTVNRASVHERIWASNDEFRRDVMAATIRHLPTTVVGGSGQAVRQLIQDQYRRGLGPHERRSELSRFLAPAAFDMASDQLALRRMQVTKALASPPSRSLQTDLVGQALRERFDSVQAGLRERLAQVTAGLGLRPRSDLVEGATAHDVLAAVTINTFIGGLLGGAAGADEIRRPLAFDGIPTDDPMPWTPMGIVMDAIVDLLFEPVGDDGRHRPDVPVPAPPPPVRPPDLDLGPATGRRPRSKLRDLVIGSGVEILLEQRLDLRPRSLSWASVFEHVERTRGVKVYRSQVSRRIWSSHDAYWLDVLDRAVRSEPGPAPTTLAALGAPPAPAPDDHPTHRRLAGRDRIRLLLAGEAAADLASAPTRRRLAVEAALLVEDDPAPLAPLRRVLADVRSTRVDGYRQALRQHVLPLGFELRPEAGIDEDEGLALLASLAATTVAGAVFDQAAGVERVGRTYPLRRTVSTTGVADANEPADRPGGIEDYEGWSVPGLVVWAVFDRLFRIREDRRAGVGGP